MSFPPFTPATTLSKLRQLQGEEARRNGEEIRVAAEADGLAVFMAEITVPRSNVGIGHVSLVCEDMAQHGWRLLSHSHSFPRPADDEPQRVIFMLCFEKTRVLV